MNFELVTMQFYFYLLMLIISLFGLNGFFFESFIITIWNEVWSMVVCILDTNKHQLRWVIHKMKWLKQKQRYELNKTVSIFYNFFFSQCRIGCDEINQIFNWLNGIQPSTVKPTKKKHLFFSVIRTVVSVIAWLFLSFVQYNFGRRFEIWNKICVRTTREKKNNYIVYCGFWSLVSLLIIIMKSIPDIIFFVRRIFVVFFFSFPKSFFSRWLVFS